MASYQIIGLKDSEYVPKDIHPYGHDEGEKVGARVVIVGSLECTKGLIHSFSKSQLSACCMY